MKQALVLTSWMGEVSRVFLLDEPLSAIQIAELGKTANFYNQRILETEIVECEDLASVEQEIKEVNGDE